MAASAAPVDPSALKLAPTRMTQMTTTRRIALAAPLAVLAGAQAAHAEPGRAPKLAADSKAALDRLYSTNTKARELGQKALAILVFPRIVKAGLVVGGQGGGRRALRERPGRRVLQHLRRLLRPAGGAQAFSYALFFITQSSLDYLKKSEGWSIGSGPSVVIVDSGAAKSMTTTSLHDDVYAFVFGQKGLMAGIGLEGSKITQIYPDP